MVFTDLDEILSYKNPSSQEVMGITITSNNKKLVKTDVNIEIADIISVKVTGEEQLSKSTKDELSIIFSGTKPWYSLLCKNKTICYRTKILFDSNFSFWMVLFSRTLRETGTKKLGMFFLSNSGVTTVVVILYVCVLWLSDPFWSWLFPKSFFALGQGKIRYQNLEMGRKIMIGIFSSTVVGVIVGWIVKFLVMNQ